MKRTTVGLVSLGLGIGIGIFTAVGAMGDNWHLAAMTTGASWTSLAAAYFLVVE